MKVSPEHLKEIADAIEALFVHMQEKNGLTRKDIEDRYRERRIFRGDAVQDINKRYRWDLYWGAALLAGSLPDSTNGYNDAHIYTALKSLVPAIEE